MHRFALLGVLVLAAGCGSTEPAETFASSVAINFPTVTLGVGQA
jgi:hypothetical protein